MSIDKCKNADYSRYYGEMLCSKYGMPCRVAQLAEDLKHQIGSQSSKLQNVPISPTDRDVVEIIG